MTDSPTEQPESQQNLYQRRIGNIDEERAQQRYDEVGLGAGPEAAGQRVHVGDAHRSCTQTHADEA